MAEYLLSESFPDRVIHSAGIQGVVGHGADEKAINCMNSIGIDMQNHVARKLNADMVKTADLILVMSQNQLKHLEQTWSFAKGKTFRLGHWQSINIADPYQHDQSFFNDTFELIQSCVNDWKKQI